MPEKISAGGLLDSLKKTLGLGAKQPPEVQVAGVTSPVVPETPAAIEMPAATPAVPALESATLMATEATSAGETASSAKPQADDREVWVSPDSTGVPSADAGLPDWLQGGQAAAPLLEPEAPEISVPAVATAAPKAVEAPAPIPAPEAQVEGDPFVTNREFNRHMETIRLAQTILMSGLELTPENKRNALIAIARANSLLPKLPPEVLKSILLMRAVAANNPNFGRNDFQLEMLAAMNVIKTGEAIKG